MLDPAEAPLPSEHPSIMVSHPRPADPVATEQLLRDLGVLAEKDRGELAEWLMTVAAATEPASGVSQRIP